MIFKFDLFLESRYNKQSRGEIMEIGREEALEKYAPWYDWYKCETPLFRSVKTGGEVKKLDPSGKKRHTLGGGHSFYQTIIDNWEGYPKRSESIITSTSNEFINIYGDYLYRVIPLVEDSEIVALPTNDIWGSFELSECSKYLNMPPYSSLSTLSDVIHRIFFTSMGDVDITSMKNTLDKASLEIKNREYYINNVFRSDSLIDEFFEKYPGGFFEFLTSIISPYNSKHNIGTKFEVLKYNNETDIITPDVRHGREVYIPTECLLVLENTDYT